MVLLFNSLDVGGCGKSGVFITLCLVNWVARFGILFFSGFICGFGRIYACIERLFIVDTLMNNEL